mmetsp:Transcript_100580/g.290504  ORF Transcript_100580/g.290504 Transcript_100580/m.290504 type:complete len:373 (-) Transcript_100580:525-1643(-)
MLLGARQGALAEPLMSARILSTPSCKILATIPPTSQEMAEFVDKRAAPARLPVPSAVIDRACIAAASAPATPLITAKALSDSAAAEAAAAPRSPASLTVGRQAAELAALSVATASAMSPISVPAMSPTRSELVSPALLCSRSSGTCALDKATAPAMPPRIPCTISALCRSTWERSVAPAALVARSERESTTRSPCNVLSAAAIDCAMVASGTPNMIVEFPPGAELVSCPPPASAVAKGTTTLRASANATSVGAKAALPPAVGSTPVASDPARAAARAPTTLVSNPLAMSDSGDSTRDMSMVAQDSQDANRRLASGVSSWSGVTTSDRAATVASPVDCKLTGSPCPLARSLFGEPRAWPLPPTAPACGVDVPS